MNKELLTFNNIEFGEVKITEINGEIHFSGRDVGRALGYKNAHNALVQHCKHVVKYLAPHPQSEHKVIEMSFIPEGDLYRLVACSQMPTAKKFELWIFDEVLPAMRKTGGYVANEDLFINTYIPHADDNTKLLFRTTLQTIRKQNDLIAEYKPKALYADKMLKVENNILVRDFAKLMSDNGFKIGEKQLYSWLRKEKFLMLNNQPYQKYVSNGIFVTRGAVLKMNQLDIQKQTTLITPKGQAYLFKKIQADSKETHGKD